MEDPMSATCPTEAEHATPAGAFRRYYREIHRGLRRLNVPHSALDDATQDVFLVVHRRWGEFERRSSLRTWIWAIAVRVASEHRKKQKSSRERLANLGSEPREQPTTPERHAERADAARIVLRILDELSIKDREIIVCVALEGFSVPEASGLLGIPVQTAYSRYNKARQRFGTLARRFTRARQQVENG